MAAGRGRRRLVRRPAAKQPAPAEVDFALPRREHAVSIVAALTLAAGYCLIPQPACMEWLLAAVPQDTVRFGLRVLAAVHAAEAVGVYVACACLRRRGAELSAGTQARFAASTLVFGVFAAAALWRQHAAAAAKNAHR
ncbi:hypothetical protein H4R18_005923 [Coemansia javaensis]|uniref:Uncharacterized protein n=1 Tax=Coemansia javaensis TaxID=2761396 RepID=A0A9W8H135_9FUNG|nr:hypothetical protein H4R18_005923 [Coemansia javaensis]